MVLPEFSLRILFTSSNFLTNYNPKIGVDFSG
jgi:hypothetical protein